MAILFALPSLLFAVGAIALAAALTQLVARALRRLLRAGVAAARAGRAPPSLDAVDLARFAPKVREAVAAVVGEGPRFAQLANSCPAALVALACPGEGEEAAARAARGRELVRAGRPLAEICAALGAPLWLRRARPETFEGPLPALPDGAELRRRIAVYVPAGAAPIDCHADEPSRWFAFVRCAFETADEEVAIWTARCAAREPAEIWGHDLRAILLWAWFSRHVPGEGPVWSPSMGWARARVLTQAWREQAEFAIFGGPPEWALAEEEVEGFLFTPLATQAEIVEEGAAMGHCVATYAGDVATGECALWSMRRGEERVATLELGNACGAEFVSVRQLYGPRNEPASRDVWRAATLFALGRAEASEGAPATRSSAEEARVRWQAFFAPYWAAKGGVRAWAPLAPQQDGIAQ